MGIRAEAVYADQKHFSNYTSSTLMATPFTPVHYARTRFIPNTGLFLCGLGCDKYYTALLYH